MAEGAEPDGAGGETLEALLAGREQKASAALDRPFPAPRLGVFDVSTYSMCLLLVPHSGAGVALSVLSAVQVGRSSLR